MIFKNKYTIGIEDVAFRNEATNRTLLSIMEDVATLHSDNVGYGLNDIEITRKGWVLLDWKLEVVRRPKYNESVEVSTWSRRFERAYAYRDYLFKDENGEIIIKATSRWILFDIDTRRPQRLTEEIGELYKSEPDISAFEEEMTELKVDTELLENAVRTSYTVLRRDIDINRHMHNITYLEVALEAIPMEIYESKTFNSVRIHYKKEIRFDDAVVCAYYNQGDVHTVIMMVNEKVNAIIELS